ncbi:VPLPA-CTERM protein sorting domain-containing protein [Oceanicella actignis]|uniref:VPLPA-CTERM protein sorting domain-containing protein n=2 Tax=Oceanicella actignis TaxID=1189325 RepID=A0A1M7SH07_9RHOB|nr:putative secreted protein [Oceanicella actignis]SET20548.1 VPLPA-CTERM protein sorting domain-containing protein [Oceanicella actignis]SHN57721.1 VPLPA-CTERM protein sorting domain-containing protein [Oceanicella actignis]
MLKKVSLAMAFAAFAWGGTASAAVYYGQDVTGVNPDDSATWVNSNAARASFLSALSNVGSQDFESFADGQTPPVSMNFPGSTGSITATMSAGGRVQAENATEARKGRFATSGSQYYLIGTGQGGTTITFSADVAAFGFYGTDIGDFNGQLVLDFLDDANNVLFSENVGMAGPNGNILFWGITSQSNPFNAVRFRAIGSNDQFGFDDFIISDARQINPVPVPAAGLLLLSGFAGLAGMRLRRKG